MLHKVNIVRTAVLGLCLLGACAATLTTHAQAQPPDKVVRLGILCGAPCEGRGYDALSDGLTRLGWIEGRNLIVDRRGAEGEQDRLPALAAELVALKPDLIVAVAPQPTRAARDAAGPFHRDGRSCRPVAVGLVRGLARPERTITGFTTLVPGGFGGKLLDLLKQAVPDMTRVAALVNPKNEVAMKLFPAEMPPAALRLGLQLQVVRASSPAELQDAVDAAVRERAEALLVFGDPLFHTPPQRLPEMVARARLPAIYLVREVTQAGGLMSYVPDFDDMFRHAACYVDRILRGTKPTDLPIEQPAKFELVVNLKTAQALGLAIAPALLQRADVVIH